MKTILRRTPDEIKSLLTGAKRVCLCCHLNPDGDAIGSMLALMLALESKGYTVDAFCQDKVPDQLHVLPCWDRIRDPLLAGDERWDVMIAVDCADEARLGTGTALIPHAEHTAQIDHHGTNTGYMQVNSVDGSAIAAALLVWEQLNCMQIAVTSDIAICLYTALATDSGNFAYEATTGEAFRCMSALMDAGLPLSRMNRLLFRTRSKAQVRLLGRAINSLVFSPDGRISVMTLSQNDFAECGALPEHSDTVVNFGLDQEGVAMAALVRETPDGKVKLSLRSVPPHRVSDIAQRYGGGGHPQAAGCSMQLPLREAAQTIMAELQNALNGERE